MEKIRNLSLKKTIILYMLINLLVSFFLSALLTVAAERTQKQIWLRYADEEEYIMAQQKEKGNYTVSAARPSQEEMSEMDWKVSEVCDFLETYSVLVLSVMGSWIAVWLFYRNKLQEPILELKEASRMIAENELEFHINYENRDELGRLCAEFEKMRAQLEENNQKLWRMIEEEKALRAAIAHDIRSPLSVLKGYQEMLLTFLPEETLDKEKIMEMSEESQKQIQRMQTFIETMQKMNRLEERELHLTDTNTAFLKEQIQKEARMMGRETEIRCEVFSGTRQESVSIDRELVLGVAENLLSNSFRYAKEKIEVEISVAQNRLTLTVRDDGTGFREDSETVTKAFYHSNPRDDLAHFGMGMYLCKIYCERHGGKLLVGNAADGGAVVQAVFQLNSNKK